MRWTLSLRTALAEEVVAIDGKALRRAIAAGQSPRVLVGRGQRTSSASAMWTQ